MDRVEEIIFTKGWDRTSPADRRRALDIALAADKELAANVTDEDEIQVIANPAPNPEIDSDSWRDVPDPGGARWRQKPDVYSEDEPQLYGAQEALAEELGGVAGRGEGIARYHMAVAAAARMGLRMGRPADRRVIMAEGVYAKVNPTASVSQSVTLDEATWALSKQEKLSMSESREQTVALTERVARLRPDLVDNYSAGRDTRRPSPRRTPTSDEAADALDREARALLKEQDCAPSDNAMTRARAYVLSTRKNISPRYGSN